MTTTARSGFVAMEMKAGGYLDTNTELKNPEPALDRAFACGGPVLVDVATARQELVLPPRIQLDQAKGFSLFLLKAIINGRGNEVAELVRTSLRR